MLRFIGVSSGAAGLWKKRKKIPDGSLAKVVERTNVNLEWLKTGEGEMRPQEQNLGHLPETVQAAIYQIGKVNKIELSRREFILVSLFRQIPEERQIDIIEELGFTAAAANIAKANKPS